MFRGFRVSTKKILVLLPVTHTHTQQFKTIITTNKYQTGHNITHTFYSSSLALSWPLWLWLWCWFSFGSFGSLGQLKLHVEIQFRICPKILIEPQQRDAVLQPGISILAVAVTAVGVSVDAGASYGAAQLVNLFFFFSSYFLCDCVLCERQVFCYVFLPSTCGQRVQMLPNLVVQKFGAPFVLALLALQLI